MRLLLWLLVGLLLSPITIPIITIAVIGFCFVVVLAGFSWLARTGIDVIYASLVFVYEGTWSWEWPKFWE